MSTHGKDSGHSGRLGTGFSQEIFNELMGNQVPKHPHAGTYALTPGPYDMRTPRVGQAFSAGWLTVFRVSGPTGDAE